MELIRSYTVPHGIYSESLICRGEELIFSRDIFSWRLKTHPIAFKDIIAYALIPHEVFRPMGQVSGGPNALLVLKYRQGKKLKRIVFYLNTQNPEAEHILSTLGAQTDPKINLTTLGPTRAQKALGLVPFRYYLLLVVLMMIFLIYGAMKLSSAINGEILTYSLLLSLFLLYLTSERLYAGW